MVLYVRLCVPLCALVVLLAGCATAPASVDAPPRFLVSKTQEAQLTRVFEQVKREAVVLPRKSLSVGDVERLLVARDQEVAMILAPEQLSDYRVLHRSRFAEMVYDAVMTVHHSGPDTGLRSRGGNSPPPPDISY